MILFQQLFKDIVAILYDEEQQQVAATTPEPTPTFKRDLAPVKVESTPLKPTQPTTNATSKHPTCVDLSSTHVVCCDLKPNIQEREISNIFNAAMGIRPSWVRIVRGSSGRTSAQVKFDSPEEASRGMYLRKLRVILYVWVRLVDRQTQIAM
jgi:hypothetical protein